MDNKNRDTIIFAVSLILKAAIVAAKYSGRVRKRSLKRLAAMDIDEKDKEILFLIDKVYQLNTQISILLKRVKKHQNKPRYTIRERLLILWHMETFQIPRRKIARHLGVSKSTVYRWLHKIEEDKQAHIPANKTPKDIAALVWEITKANIDWGRFRIANQLGLLNVFISASTVRNILKQPAPENPPASILKKATDDKEEPKSIPAWYPNHVWSIDATEVTCWGLWPIHVCVVIDHFSRKVVSVTPLEGP
ncbi:MAG: helix-turn-helix domain-containing protein, partial [Chloroflexi bacterium]|nr:helix-turn-helix domain-containing protein [Chloroflexota bacterium]